MQCFVSGGKSDFWNPVARIGIYQLNDTDASGTDYETRYAAVTWCAACAGGSSGGGEPSTPRRLLASPAVQRPAHMACWAFAAASSLLLRLCRRAAPCRRVNRQYKLQGEVDFDIALLLLSEPSTKVTAGLPSFIREWPARAGRVTERGGAACKDGARACGMTRGSTCSVCVVPAHLPSPPPAPPPCPAAAKPQLPLPATTPLSVMGWGDNGTIPTTYFAMNTLQEVRSGLLCSVRAASMAGRGAGRAGEAAACSSA